MMPTMKTEFIPDRTNAEAQRTQRSAEKIIYSFLRVSPRPPRLCVSPVLAVLLLCVFALIPFGGHAATTNLTALLQQGLFEEQANRNLDAAIAAYSSLATQFDKDRQLAATAVFRLGECYRAQGKTNEAAAHYQRILRDFPDQTTLATLSRQNLAGMGAGKTETATAVAVENSDAQLLKKLEGKTTDELEKILPTVLPDAALSDLLQKRDTTQAERNMLLVDFPTNNLQVVRKDTLLTELNKQLGEKISGMMAGLKLRAEISPSSSVSKKVAQTDLSPPGKSEEDKEIDRIEKMIQNSPDLINARDEGGNTPLMQAASKGWLMVATFLIEHGADVNGGETSALICAATAGNRAMVEFLLRRGADVNAKDNYGNAPLNAAVGKKFPTVVEVLLANKANVNLPGGDGNTPLAAAVINKQSKIVESLLAAGANPNLENKAGRTALSFAAATGSAEVVKLLLAAKADANIGKLNAPLRVAIQAKDAAVVELLLAAGADVNARVSADEGTSLHLAADAGKREVVECLLAHGAEVNATVTSGQRNVTPLMRAANGGFDEIVLLLLQHKADPNLADSAGMTALVYAVYQEHVAVVKTLLAHGANPDVRQYENPVIIIAIDRRQNKEIIAELLGAKADVNAVGEKQQQSALHFAVSDGKTELVKLFLSAHADVNLRDKNGETPLHLAVRANADDIAALLLEAKADPNLRNNYGQTPLDLLKSNPSSNRRIGFGAVPRPPGGVSVGGVTLSSSSQNSSPDTTKPAPDLADLLRQHGALDALPDFTRIRITRQGLANPLEVFQQGAKLTNHFTLLETVMRFYSLPQVFVSGQGGQESWRALPFPDFGRIIIRRPSQKIGGKEQEIKVSLLNRSNVVDCARDVPVEFGDVIEIPESVHALNADTPNPVQELEWNIRIAPKKEVQPGSFEARLKAAITESSAPNASPYRTTAQCLQKSVQLVVAGETTTFKVNSWKEGFLFSALGKTEARSALRSSSDLSRVTVTRKTKNSAKPAVFTVDVSDASQRNDDLWLQDGDVIEVPEKR